MEPRIACILAHSEAARVARAALAAQGPLVEPEEAQVLVVLGGDGTLLHAFHRYRDLGLPFYGVNCGTRGFLLNDGPVEDLPARIAAARSHILHALALTAVDTQGKEHHSVAFNEVALIRSSAQSAWLRVVVDGVERLGGFVGDGVLVSTPAGSTGYNLSAHGPIVPLGAALLALTPVSPCRPRRWRGALLPESTVVEMENLDPPKRPLTATADAREIPLVVRARIRLDKGSSVTVLFDPGQSLAEKVAREQFEA
jgi:NAD+ kinase